MLSTDKPGKLALDVGGGPAPGINGVISAVTIEAVEQGLEVIGCRDGFKALVEGKLKPEERVVEMGAALVKQVFVISRVGAVAGCQVIRDG